MKRFEHNKIFVENKKLGWFRKYLHSVQNFELHEISCKGAFPLPQILRIYCIVFFIATIFHHISSNLWQLHLLYHPDLILAHFSLFKCIKISRESFSSAYIHSHYQKNQTNITVSDKNTISTFETDIFRNIIVIKPVRIFNLL